MNTVDKSSWLITLTYWDLIIIHKRLLYRVIKHSSTGPVHPGCVGCIIVSFRVIGKTAWLHPPAPDAGDLPVFSYSVIFCIYIYTVYVNISTARSSKNQPLGCLNQAPQMEIYPEVAFEGESSRAGRNLPIKDSPVEIHEDVKVRRKTHKCCLWVSDHTNSDVVSSHVCLHLYDVAQRLNSV